MRLGVRLLCLCLVTGAVGAGFTLHEENAGVVDWHLENIGAVDASFFSADKEKVFVNTKSNVVAALNARNGKIEWRQVFDAEGATKLLPLHSATTLLHVSWASGRVRAISATRGTQQWTVSVGAGQLLDVAVLGSDVVILARTRIEFHGGIDGKLMWHKDLSREADSGTIATTDKELRAFYISDGSMSVLTGTSSGAKGEQKLFAVGNPRLVAAGGAVIWLEGKTLHSTTGSANKQSLTLQELLGSGAMGSVHLYSTGSYGVVQSPAAVAVIQPKDGALNRMKVITGHAAVTANGEQLLAVQSSAEGLIVTRWSAESDEVHSVVKDASVGLAVPVNVDGEGITKGSESWTLVVTSSDQSVRLVKSSSKGVVVRWTREEALAQSQQAVFVRLPNGDNAHLSHVYEALGIVEDPALRPGVVSGFINRLSYQVEALTELVSNLAAGQLPWTDADNKGALTSDKFAFRQLIVVMTGARKLFAVHTDGGAVVWNRYLGAQLSDLDTPTVHLVRSALHGSPRCIVIGRSATNPAQSLLIAIDPITGAVLETRSLNYRVTQVFPLPLHLDDHLTALGLVDDAWKVHSEPESVASTAAFESLRSQLFLYSVNETTGTLQGYVLSKGAPATGVPTWTVGLGSDSSSAMPAASEQVAEAVRRLNDGSVIYKHVERNVIAMATVASESTQDGKSKSVLDSAVNVHVINTATGRYLYRAVVRKARGPVKLIVVENSIIFQYWSIKNSRFELGSLDLYDAADDVKDRNVDSYSSFSRPAPIVVQQSYILPTEITAIGVTQTSQGITSKQLLLGLATGQLQVIDKALVDARRPLGGAAPEEGAAEFLRPYHANLTLPDTQLASYSRQVPRVQHIVAAGCELESHSLVLAMGLDLFFTRLTPSQAFDILGASFQYKELLLITASIFVGVVIFKALSDRKELSQRWE